MKPILAVTAILSSLVTGLASAQEANYFEREVTVPIASATQVGDLLTPPTGMYASVRTVSVWCEFLDTAVPGVVVLLSTPGFANGVGALSVPMSLQFVDNKAASPTAYFAGTVTPFWEVPPRDTSRVTITSDATNGGGECHVTAYGVMVQ